MTVEVSEVSDVARYMIDYDGGSAWEATFDAAVETAKKETKGTMNEAVIYRRCGVVCSLGTLKVIDDPEPASAESRAESVASTEEPRE